MGLWTFYNLLRRPFRNNSSAVVSAFRSDIDNIIRCLNDIQIVLNDHDCIAVRRQSSQRILGQLMDIRKMKSRRRLIQDVDRLPRAPLAQLRRQLNSLCLSSGKCCGWLSQPNIGKSHIVQCLHFPPDTRSHVRKNSSASSTVIFSTS